VNGIAPPPGTELKLGEMDAGEMRSAIGDWGLALIRLDAWRKAQTEGGILTAAGGAKLRPFVPEWMQIPAEKPKSLP
jgi:hypothetical protein